MTRSTFPMVTEQDTTNVVGRARGAHRVDRERSSGVLPAEHRAVQTPSYLLRPRPGRPRLRDHRPETAPAIVATCSSPFRWAAVPDGLVTDLPHVGRAA